MTPQRRMMVDDLVLSLREGWDGEEISFTSEFGDLFF